MMSSTKVDIHKEVFHLAFNLFDEMINEYHIKPNGMTYCALIDVCGRCGRSDLALKGLRMMLREKAK